MQKELVQMKKENKLPNSFDDYWEVKMQEYEEKLEKTKTEIKVKENYQSCFAEFFS